MPRKGKTEYNLGKESSSVKDTEDPDLKTCHLFDVVKVCDADAKVKMKGDEGLGRTQELKPGELVRCTDKLGTSPEDEVHN